jgi:hypothetical protein
MWKLRIGNALCSCTFTSVFHRILDFKTGPDFYPALFLCWLSAADSKLDLRFLLCLLLYQKHTGCRLLHATEVAAHFFAEDTTGKSAGIKASPFWSAFREKLVQHGIAIRHRKEGICEGK